MGGIVINLLGPFEVWLDGETVTAFESDKVRALLAYLASEPGQAHRRATLASLLWPERPESAARTNLRHVLANLRKAIKDQKADPPHLLITRQTIQFNFESQSKIDILIFMNLLRDGSAHLISQLEQAVKLYRGDFLKGFSLDDSIPFEEWALLKREEISRKMISALKTLSYHYERAGDFEKAIEYAQRQVALEPWEEATHQRLMILYALSGRDTAALKQYEDCKHGLRTELDIDPSPKTIKLFEKIRDGSFYPPVSLPIQSTPFVGREGELAALDDLFTNLDRRLVTILGPGGIGKTRLAQAFAELLVNTSALFTQYSDGVFFVDLAPLPEVASLVLNLTESFNLRIQAGAGEKRSPKQQLLDYLQNKHLLLVLDNFEHMLYPRQHPEKQITDDAAILVSEILMAASDVQILVTSRERLNLQMEQVFAIDGLEYPKVEANEQEIVVDNLETYTAVQLFLQIAQRSHYNFSLESDDERLALTRICEVVEGMPLALEMIASRVNTISPVDIVVEIQQSLDFLKTRMRDVPARQRSVRAAFDTSWQNLDDEEQSVFAQLSIFRGSFNRQAAQTVTGATALQLQRLVNKSFVQFNQQRNRYQIHELLRQFGAECLKQIANLEERVLQNRHSNYYCQLLADLTENQKNAGATQAESDIQTDIENVRLAWRHAIEHGDIGAIGASADSLHRFYQNTGWFLQGVNEFEKAVAGLRTGDLVGDKGIALGRILAFLGRLYSRIHQKKKASIVLEESLTLLQQFGTREQILLSRIYLAEVQESPEQAYRLYTACLPLARKSGDPWMIAHVLQHMGVFARDMGEYGQAEERLQQALQQFRQNDDRGGIVYTLSHLSDLACDLGRYQEALSLARECMSAAQKLNFPAVGYGALGKALYALGYYVEAEEQSQHALTAIREVDMKPWISIALFYLGKIAFQVGDYARAETQLQESLTVALEFDNLQLVALNHDALARSNLAHKEHNIAADHLKIALQTVIAMCQPPILLAVLTSIAELLVEGCDLNYAVLLATFVSHHSASQAKVKERATRILIRIEPLLTAGEMNKAQQAIRQTDLENLAAQVLIDLEKL